MLHIRHWGAATRSDVCTHADRTRDDNITRVSVRNDWRRLYCSTQHVRDLRCVVFDVLGGDNNNRYYLLLVVSARQCTKRTLRRHVVGGVQNKCQSHERERCCSPVAVEEW